MPVRPLALAVALLAGAVARADIAIDYAFIAKLEGNRILTASVPAPKTSNSGVTVGTGVDLGSKTEAGLTAIGVSAALVAKVKPYLGLTKQAAVDKIAVAPLTLTDGEAKELDEAVRTAITKTVATQYDKAVAGTDRKKFADLPAAAQTVIFSVAYQYGTLWEAGKKKETRFWAHVTAQDWKAAVKELYHFGDGYSGRRFAEGDLLATLVPDLPKIEKSVGVGGVNQEKDVKVVQQLLKDKGVYAGSVSGTCDDATKAAIKVFQKQIYGDMGLKANPDGVVDPPDAAVPARRSTFRRLLGRTDPTWQPLANAVAKEDWATAFKFLNGLSMTDQLGALHTLSTTDRDALAAKRADFADVYGDGMKRMTFAFDVVREKKLPALLPLAEIVPADQVEEAKAMLNKWGSMK